MRNKWIWFVAGSFALTACHKEELPVPAHDAGDAVNVEIAMGQDYRQQVFYRLSDDVVVSSNLKTEWDLAFESAADGWHILLNSSRGMAVHQSTAAFADITSENGLSWSWDVQSGNLDSTAFGDWTAGNYLYVIDMGYDYLGTHLGYRKMQVTGMDAGSYTIAWGDLSAQTASGVTILKNTSNLYTYFKFGTGVVNIAPPNEEWDLMFTQYTHLFTDPVEAYVVTGVLLNRYNTTAAEITDKPFGEIVLEDIASLSFSSAVDYIGYDWKYFDFGAEMYTVDPTVTYIVQTSEGFYYKLHFLDFYNDQGEKGYPEMEIVKL